ncbi:MAG: hypothetical protein E5Y29_25440 [Mesorhizobium sp.]|nr:MAG: hypothetical protein E5Y29_25440 [Mesorhizobium sp.]
MLLRGPSGRQVNILGDSAPDRPVLIIGVEAAEPERRDQRKVFSEELWRLDDDVDGLGIVEDNYIASTAMNAAASR